MAQITGATGPAVALAGGRTPADMPPARRRWTLALAGLGAFIAGFRPAEWTAAAVAAAGVPIAALAPSKSAQEEIR